MTRESFARELAEAVYRARRLGLSQEDIVRALAAATRVESKDLDRERTA